MVTFVNNFQFNLVVMFVYFVNQASVINLIYSEKHQFIIVRILPMADLSFAYSAWVILAAEHH